MTDQKELLTTDLDKLDGSNTTTDAEFLISQGWLQLPEDPKDLFEGEGYTGIAAERIQALVNFIVQMERDHAAADKADQSPLKVGESVMVLKNGSFIPGVVNIIEGWGALEISTERGPVTVWPKSPSVRRRVAGDTL
jgi:hypothetical protein